MATPSSFGKTQNKITNFLQKISTTARHSQATVPDLQNKNKLSKGKNSKANSDKKNKFIPVTKLKTKNMNEDLIFQCKNIA